MPNQMTSQSPISEWLQNPWKVTISALLTAVTFFGIGYSIATHNCDQDFRIQKMELKQEYNEKVQNIMNDCKNGKEKEHVENNHSMYMLIPYYKYSLVPIPTDEEWSILTDKNGHIKRSEKTR
ncbi:hypothetical protein SAMN04488511_102297 [Pedobacter suwonensis]|uniref:Uncharacterized protein n=1 Tax=Pedobacter suwonensis TaxID=332999 RepID=A0A1I0SPF2_9SPHI|nr:hypothetical protein [Pedobacter suwonensis]SFA41313.1 hypothetical protein SAMN04488511_102297 [Pedobacter suwonensis]